MVAITKYILLFAPITAALHINRPGVNSLNSKARTVSGIANALTLTISKHGDENLQKEVPAQAPSPEENEINILIQSLTTVETTLTSFAHTLKSFSDAANTISIDDEFIALALALENATPPPTLSSLDKEETKNITIHITKIKRGIKPVLAQFSRKSKLFPTGYLSECQDAFEVLKDQSDGLAEALLGHVSAETKERKELDLELHRVNALFGMGEKYFERLSHKHQPEHTAISSTKTMGVTISAETEVDSALYEITRTTQHLSNAINSIKDDDSDDLKKDTIDPPFKELETSFRKLANSNDLRELTKRESEDRLALVQTVRFLVKESMDSLVGKAVVLPEDFKKDLVRRLEGLEDLGRDVAAVVRYGVVVERQMELSAELLAIDDSFQWAADSLKPAKGKTSAFIQGNDNVASVKHNNFSNIKSAGKKAVSSVKSALEKVAMRIELR